MNDTNNFAEDLASVQTEVSEDIGGLLRVVKDMKEKKAKPQASSEGISPRQQEPQPTEVESKQRTSPPTNQRDDHEEGILENVTTRLSKATNGRLTDAALHQRLKKIEPNTRQGIIETAVRDWLKRNKYA